MTYKITNGFDIKDDLKSNGGKYFPADKSWIISDAAFEKLDSRTQSYGMRWIHAWNKAKKEKISESLDGANTPDIIAA